MTARPPRNSRFLTNATTAIQPTTATVLHRAQNPAMPRVETEIHLREDRIKHLLER